jgi:hypothetical protein
MRLKASTGLAAFAVTLACAFAAVATVGAAPTATRDAASTRAFIAGELATTRAILAHRPAELAAGKAYVAGVERECGDVRLRPRRLGPQRLLMFLQFAMEVGVSYEDVVFAPARPAIDRISRRQQRLRFSDPMLQWRVRTHASAFATMLALRPPEICADVRRLAATKFTAMTPAGRRFSSDALTLAESSRDPGALMRQMDPYAPGAVASGLRRLKTLSHKVTHSPAARLAGRLFRRLLGPGTSGSSARFESLLGSLGHARL